VPESQLCSNKNISLVKNNCFVNYKLCNYCSRAWPSHSGQGQYKLWTAKQKRNLHFSRAPRRVAKRETLIWLSGKIGGRSTRKRGRVNNTILANISGSVTMATTAAGYPVSVWHSTKRIFACGTGGVPTTCLICVTRAVGESVPILKGFRFFCSGSMATTWQFWPGLKRPRSTDHGFVICSLDKRGTNPA